MRKRFFRPAVFRSPGFVAATLLLIVLVVQYGIAWYGIEVVKISKEADFDEHLRDLGRLAGPSLSDGALEIRDLAFAVDTDLELLSEDLPAAAEEREAVLDEYRGRVTTLLRQPFERFADEARLTTLCLLDENGRVLLCSGDPDAMLANYAFLEVDREQFETALGGESAESIAYSVDDSLYKRVYVPIADPDADGVGAILVMTAGREYLGTLSLLAQNMRILSAVSTLLLLVLGLIVYRLVMRQREYERSAAHADRLSSLGSLAAGFAHEIRNPLEIIRACTEDLDRALAGEPSVSPDSVESCRDILEEVDRMNELVSQFLQYSRTEPAAGASAATSLGDCVDSAVAMLRHTADQRRVAIGWPGRTDSARARVALDESSLRQIVINLVMNAIQATPEGGRVDLEESDEGKFIRLEILDSGPGVAAAMRSRIFDPFFTTRDQGSGLGLSIAHQLAERAGGRLSYEEKASTRGACFVLRLPRARAEGSVAAGVAHAVG